MKPTVTRGQQPYIAKTSNWLISNFTVFLQEIRSTSAMLCKNSNGGLLHQDDGDQLSVLVTSHPWQCSFLQLRRTRVMHERCQGGNGLEFLTVFLETEHHVEGLRHFQACTSVKVRPFQNVKGEGKHTFSAGWPCLLLQRQGERKSNIL